LIEEFVMNFINYGKTSTWIFIWQIPRQTT
jgi:hypothetical protein